MSEQTEAETHSWRAELETRLIQGCPTRAWLFREVEDPPWDEFLRTTPLGQFQQSSLWARVKQLDGWHSFRVLLTQGDQIVSGFQILWRRTRFGRIGYISKGPVIPEEPPDGLDFVLDLLDDSVRTLRLAALLIQPPDLSRGLEMALARRGFAPNHLMGIISASCWVPLTGGTAAWEQRISRSRLNEVRRAARRGVTVREGNDADIPKFFELMSSTCKRQGVQPNPSSLEALQQLVSVFRASGESRISFADCEGETMACVLELRFGGRMTAWKKGWNGTFADRHPNSFLAYESLRWAAGLGLQHLDFAGMDRHLAECLLARRPLTEEQKKGRDIFNLSFGAEPHLLPPALILWRNQLVRLIYRRVVASSRMAWALGRVGRRLGKT